MAAKRIMKALIPILALILLSCGPAAKLRRAEKLIAKAELQGGQWHIDTVYRTMEIPVPEVRHDTAFVSQPGDTVVIEKERLRIRYVSLPADSVYIEGECLPDTVRIEVPVVVNKTIDAPKSKGIRLWWLVVAVLGTGIVVKLFSR